jgi:hypothetical protein
MILGQLVAFSCIFVLPKLQIYVHSKNKNLLRLVIYKYQRLDLSNHQSLNHNSQINTHMAHANPDLINALRITAKKLAEGGNYQWGHMGSCNCGNLAQELTTLTKAEIHQFAMQGRGDWREQVEEFCPTSGLNIDLLIADLLNRGLTVTDLPDLEWLSDQKILKRIPFERRNKMRHNVREDVVLYMTEWARMLEEQLIPHIRIDLSFLATAEGEQSMVNDSLLEALV